MGAAGRRRAKALFDWRVVVGRYQELWGEQAAIRDAASRSAGARAARDGPAHPLRDNPFALFGHYADPHARAGEPAARRRRAPPAAGRSGWRPCGCAGSTAGPPIPRR